MRQLRKSQYWKREKIESYQLYKLYKLIGDAKVNVKLYSEMYRGFNLNAIDTIDALHDLPFVNKKMVKERHNDFYSKRIPLFCTKKTTGGSTGQAVTILKSRSAMANELAATWRGYSWAGIDIGDRQARFWGVPFTGKKNNLPQMIDFVCNRTRLSAFSFTDESLRRYGKKIITFRPAYFYGYVSMIEEFAKYVEKKRLEFGQLKAVITTSEVLHKSQKEYMEKVFKAKVYNEYGCGEVGSIAHQCEYGNMHISSENMIVEILDGDRICENGEIGEIVVTELNNSVFPLIRYRLGDFGTISESQCECGRGLPILENIKGRAYDVIETEDGRKFHGEFFMYIFEEVERNNLGVARFQVKQLDFNNIVVKIVPSENYDKYSSEKLVTELARKHLGDNVKISFENVNEIIREKSGKMRLIIGMENK
jgi:phenylacetate-CoA ligase